MAQGITRSDLHVARVNDQNLSRFERLDRHVVMHNFLAELAAFNELLPQVFTD